MRLTPTDRFVGGSIFSTSPIDATLFTSRFRFRITERGGLGNGADGIVFVVQSEDAGVGSLGGGIGFDGISNSVGVEFDTFTNGSENDPSSNHVGIVTEGDVNHGSGAPFTVDVSPDFDDGNVWFAWIDYDGTTLEMRTNQSGVRPSEALLSRALDIPSILGQQTAFVGFTSATGNGFGNHDILDWRYTAIPEPETLTLLGIGVVITLLAARRESLRGI